MEQKEKDKDAEWKRLKLISVAFKEASLDTPSFRASVNTFQFKLEAFEDWIDKSVAFFQNRYTPSFENFQRAQQTFLSQLLPSPLILFNGFVANQTTTPMMVEAFNNEYFEFASRILKIIAYHDTSYPDAVLELMNNDLEPYKAKRAEFEYCQGKFDAALAKYCAIKVSNTNIEPVNIKDEALDLFEIRKSYLKASLELMAAISTLQVGLDKFLMRAVSLISEKNSFLLKEAGKRIDLAMSLTESVAAYSEWVTNAVEASELLQEDMERAKQQVIEYTLGQVTPSRELSDYNVKAINSSKLLANKSSPVLEAPEISGWLYMKTTVGTPSRQIWVRRWCFLSSSVFGLLLLSPSKTYVEETDKFGVLLIDVRYDPDEDRKFCFEVKIRGRTPEMSGDKQTRIVFQAESLKELKQWLLAFETAKRYAAKLDSNDPQYKHACRRISPAYFEFASSTTTTTDQLITTYDENSLNLIETLNKKLPNLDLASIPGRNGFQYELALTPMSTKLTQLAIFGSSIKQNTYLPSALLANIWGSTNWSDYATFKKAQKRCRDNEIKDKPHSDLDLLSNYPSFYSEKMIINDLQFKSLFFSIDQNLAKFPQDLLLFSFSSFWCPNKRQKFCATIYVTLDHIFCYMNSMGFICLTCRNLSDIASVELDPGSDHSLKLYGVDGNQLRLAVFFTDRRLIANKLQCLLENIALANPKNEEQILKQLDGIESDFQSTLKDEKLRKIRSALGQDIAHSPREAASGLYPTNTFWSMSATAAELLHRRRGFQSQSTAMYHHVYEIPCKGLMHILFGDQSSAFPRCLFLSSNDGSSNISRPWIKHDETDGERMQLQRILQFRLNLTNNFLNGLHTGGPPTILMKQSIVELIENKYCEVDQEPIIIKVPFCHPLRMKVKYVVTEPYESSTQNTLHSTSGSLLLAYYKLEFFESTTEKVVEHLSFIEKAVFRIALQATNKEFLLIRKVIRYYLERIGKHGKVIRAIKLCGMLGVSQEKVEAEAVGGTDVHKPPVVNYSISIIFKLLMKLLVYKITSLALLLIRLIFGSILVAVTNLTHINKNLLFGLIASILINVLLSGKSSFAYWSARRSDNLFQDYMQGKREILVRRAVSIKDLELLSQNLAFERNNLPFQKFNETYSAENHKFTQTRLEVAQRRNELLVELKILQNMEKELLQTNYRSFLLSEIDKCHAIEKEICVVWEQDAKLRDYCSSCREELYKLTDPLL
ncbi:hypothetical protein HG536_0B01180 [Torulaspora globosa]|uniref:PH domain-containing protein n=1 Tax=Torulaspora globosa TaxID=48254 RepID=A0A7G3ZCM1_9SACH|nr:uncharacterized protein HG536_0B01180 [Torulaspora globosa]QLL31257.1 hypothetical protein HG536_0B01180 [Torulaspora globosa]